MTELKTVWILISWLLMKPADLDLHCFQKRMYMYLCSGSTLFSEKNISVFRICCDQHHEKLEIKVACVCSTGYRLREKNRMFLVFNIFADVCKHRFSHKYYVEGFQYKEIRI